MRIQQLPQATKVFGGVAIVLCCAAVPTASIRHQGRVNADLLKAVEIGDVQLVRQALENGADPNARHVYENRPTNVGQVIQWLLRTDNIVWHECPILTEACQSENPVPIAQALLERGADPNGRSKIGYTALLDLIEQDNDQVAELLLKYGAEVNATTQTGDTALMLLSGNQFSSVRCLPLLLKYGANPHLKDRDGKTALQLAKESKHTQAIRVLKQYGVAE